MSVIVYFSSFSISFAALAAIIRFKVVDTAFYPFLILIWIGLANDLLSMWLVKVGHSNAINNNLFSLAEAGLITFQFYNWKLFVRKNYFWMIMIAIAIAWVIDNFFISRINYFSSYFAVFYSFTIVLMSILMINRVIIAAKSTLFKNPVFLICTGFIFYFTYKVLVEIFWIYGLNSSNDFRTEVYLILDYVNLFTNLIYTLAILWIPRKQEFIRQY